MVSSVSSMIHGKLRLKSWPSHRAHYTKFEHRIPMRDGARLFTAVYLPNDTSSTYPILMTRTPYSCVPYGADRYPGSLGPIREFVEEGCIFVCQDVRGRVMSEGDFVNMRPHIARKSSADDVDESSDTCDTIEWLLEHVVSARGPQPAELGAEHLRGRRGRLHHRYAPCLPLRGASYGD